MTEVEYKGYLILVDEIIGVSVFESDSKMTCFRCNGAGFSSAEDAKRAIDDGDIKSLDRLLPV